MPNYKQLEILQSTIEAWNTWREKHIGTYIDLTEASLANANLAGANLAGANLANANFIGVNLTNADLTGANLAGANLGKVNLTNADLTEVNLTNADLTGATLIKVILIKANLTNASLLMANLMMANIANANFTGANLTLANLMKTDLTLVDLTNADLTEANLALANLTGANLTGANLTGTGLVRTNLTRVNLTNCIVYGVSAWNVQLEGAIQDNLIITPKYESAITVDNLKFAQFIYLLLDNKEIRDAIDTISKKIVLILGRFTPKRKIILDAIRDTLHEYNYLPIVFDFEKPSSRDLTETISTLAHLARFVIADITQAKSIPQELGRIVPFLPSVPIQPLLQASAKEYAMFEHFRRSSCVLEMYRYTSLKNLLQALKDSLIEQAEKKAQELEPYHIP